MSDSTNTNAPSDHDENKLNTGSIILKFLREYKNKPAGESGKAWLSRQFAQYPGLWNDAEAREKDAADIADEIERILAAKAELKQHLAEGKSQELYLYMKAQECAEKNGGDPGKILKNFNRALGQANESFMESFTTEDGEVNMDPEAGDRVFEQKPVEVLDEVDVLPPDEDEVIKEAGEITDNTSASGMLKTFIQAPRIIARRGLNWATGKENPSVEKDLTEFVDESIKAGGTGLAIPVTGGITVAIRNGNLGGQLVNMPAVWITDSVWPGLENMGNMWKVEKKIIGVDEAIEEAGNTACALAGEMIRRGTTWLGRWVGSGFGPSGAEIGEKVGAAVGEFVSGPVANAIGNGVKKTCHWVKDKVEKGFKWAGKAVKRVFSWGKRAIRGVASWLGF